MFTKISTILPVMKKYENGNGPIKYDILITQHLRSILDIKLSLMAAEGYKICLKSGKETAFLGLSR